MNVTKQEEANAMFDSGAKSFADSINQQIQENRYYRGYLFRDAVLKYVKPENHSLILDYGCGIGSITKLIAEKGYRVEAFDPSPAHIALAKSHNLPAEQVKFALLTDQGESLPEKRYDAIICSSVIEFIERPEALLAHLRKSLKPGGYLLISFANRLSLWRLYAKIRFGKNKHYHFQYNVWSAGEFVHLLKKVDFKKQGRIKYFDSIFERWRFTNFLNYSVFIGTLGLIVSRKDEKVNNDFIDSK